MTELLTAQQMRELEQAAIESGDTTGLALMERAGAGVVQAMLMQWPALVEGTHTVHVYCGPGNNGGDGFVIARLLRDQGWRVEVFLFGDPKKLPTDARANHEKWCSEGTVHAWSDTVSAQLARPDVIVDAVFGLGLKRSLPPEVVQTLRISAAKVWKGAHQIKRVAVDCPSGLDLDTGLLLGADRATKQSHLHSITADLTVTFHSPKLGHYLGLGPLMCGHTEVVDIGLRGEALEAVPLMLSPDPERVRLVDGVFCGRRVPGWPMQLFSKSNSLGHKYSHGAVFVFAGGVGKGGAGRLAARTALRAGAGVVTVICPPAALQENATHLDAVMVRSIKAEQALETITDHRVSGFCLGPGMGVGAHTKSRVLEALVERADKRRRQTPVVVLDADALTSFAAEPHTLFSAVHERTVLTPHEGEFAQLFPDLAFDKRARHSKINAVREAAQKAGCIILLKGPDTVIAAPDGRCSVHSAHYERSAPWLATAGAGDVLAGLIVGLAAPHTSVPLFSMVEIAAWLHVEAALSFGPGLIAEDLPEELPKVFSALSAAEKAVSG